MIVVNRDPLSRIPVVDRRWIRQVKGDHHQTRKSTGMTSASGFGPAVEGRARPAASAVSSLP